ncbi:DUF2188 domain-containing protein [Halobacillus litoralis]|uniref:DUF2188 domain-containing protein n=1 Tax=Halobacillus litoralis TaxID=45668 RepID=A0A845E3V6_9BACI|nr:MULTISPECIES: DUF2188 domain-containing protein [Halobacillus]MCA1020800.1 DUF2188 domain-containing protein [Halobacillus litoralis]MYL20364.1 DUF2188 domain-containing protein [Halobacillus litoralis]MYL29458.1 DUF2188 domain-containing protein [Halobacillus halophilus]MYL36675.1 DUF2188 domain-containing protein [Halobacillus litoralis]
MKEYSVVPNKDVTGWFVKIEDVAPTDMYDERDTAVEKAEEIAQQNKPSRLYILDQNHEVEEERTF